MGRCGCFLPMDRADLGAHGLDLVLGIGAIHAFSSSCGILAAQPQRPSPAKLQDIFPLGLLVPLVKVPLHASDHSQRVTLCLG